VKQYVSIVRWALFIGYTVALVSSVMYDSENALIIGLLLFVIGVII